MTTTKLELGHHIWFVVHHDGGVINGLEEHDWREGGGLRLPPNMTWEQLFLRNVANRCTEGHVSPYYAAAVQLIEQIKQQSTGE